MEGYFAELFGVTRVFVRVVFVVLAMIILGIAIYVQVGANKEPKILRSKKEINVIDPSNSELDDAEVEKNLY